MKHLSVLLAFIITLAFSNAAQAGNTLAAETNLTAGQVLTNGIYALIMQGDGNLVVYANAGQRSIWDASSRGGSYARMQMDGNFVVYNSNGTWRWTSKTGGKPYNMGYLLTLNNDGSLQISIGNGPATVITPRDPALPPSFPTCPVARQYPTCVFPGSFGQFTSFVLACSIAEAKWQAAQIGEAYGACSGGF